MAVFGFGAAWYVDLFLALGIALPCLCGWAARLARRRQHDRHRAWQRGLFGIFTVVVLGVEVGIRLGGVGPGLADSPYAGSATLRTWFVLHIVIAVVTYLAWLVLVVRSSRRYRRDLPGAWSARHRRGGQAVLAGLSLTAATAMGVYYLGFVR